MSANHGEPLTLQYVLESRRRWKAARKQRTERVARVHQATCPICLKEKKELAGLIIGATRCCLDCKPIDGNLFLPLLLRLR
jgi:hypothetical protein